MEINAPLYQVTADVVVQELHGGGQTEAAGTRSGYRFGYKFGYSLAYRFELIWQICF